MKAVIMAGGRGTRIASMNHSLPKPMISIDGMPVLEHEIRCLREQGFTDVILTVSYLHEAIMNYFGDGRGNSPVTGEPFDIHIKYFVEEKPLGNAGALFRLREELTEDFLLLNADALFDVDINRFVEFHRQSGGLATLFTHPSDHLHDSGLIISDENGVVTQWLTKEDKWPQWYRNLVNAGLHVLSPKLLENAPDTARIDLDRQILKPLAGTGQMFAYTSPEYVKDMGTPERYEKVCGDFMEGRVKAKNLKNKQKAVFLDRDGTINKYVGFLRDIGEFELLSGAAEAVRRINASGYLAIIVTNQPVVARGEITEAGLQDIHNKMETLLGEEGAYIDALYYCPHHPHGGYEGENPELKIDCACRKPKPGMLLRAARDFNIDLRRSWMVGDSENDIRAGTAAGCKTAFLGSRGHDFGQTVQTGTLLQFVKEYIE